MVMDDGWSAPGNVHHRGQYGEVAGPPKKVVVEKPRRQWRITKKFVETVILSVLVFVVAMLPMVMSYVQPPESVLRMKELMAEWCTPSICFVFLVVGVMVATSGVLNGAAQAGSLRDRGDASYQRHITVVQRDSALQMPDIFSVAEGVRPLPIPVPAPVSFPGRDFPAVRPLPLYLKREVLSSRFENGVPGLSKSASTPSPQFEDLTTTTPVKVSATQSLDRESYFPRPWESAMSNSNSFQDPFTSKYNSFHERLAAQRTSVSKPGFEHDYPNVPASAASVTDSVPAVQHEVPASPAPAHTSGHSFEGTQSSILTSAHHVIDHDVPASPAMPMPHGDVAAAPSPSPTLVQEISSTSTNHTTTPTPSTRASVPAPVAHPPASPVAVRDVVVPPLPPDSPPASSVASLHPPPSLPAYRFPRTSLDATVIAPGEVHLSPIVTRQPKRSMSSKASSSSGGAFKESSGRKPPSHPGGGAMSVPAKGSTSAAKKREGELYLAMKAAAVPQSQKQRTSAPPQEATKERSSAAMGSKSVAGSAVEDTNLKPADDDVDQRVEAFLANFQQQMRLQRQESLLRQQRGEE